MFSMTFEKKYFIIDRIGLIIFLVFLIPFFSWFFPYTAFLIYILSVFLCFKYLTHIPFLFLLKIIIFMVLIFYHQGIFGSLLNIFAFILADIYSLVIGLFLFKNEFNSYREKFLKFTYIFIFLYLLVSIALSSFAGLLNPIESILNGGRFLLLSKPTDGHSVLNEIASLGLIFLLCKKNKEKNFIFKVLFFIVMLILAKSMTSILCLFAILTIYLFENLRLKDQVKNFIHVLLISLTAIFFSNQERMNDFLYFARGNIVGQDVDVYYGDYSAGRNDLNRLLIYYANESPLFGVGDEHPVLKYGVTIESGAEKGATSESPLRLATQYGWVLFLITVLINLLPLIAGFCIKKHRLFFILVGYAIIVLGGTNAGFSVPQSNLYIFFGPIVWLAWFSIKKKYFN